MYLFIRRRLFKPEVYFCLFNQNYMSKKLTQPSLEFINIIN